MFKIVNNSAIVVDNKRNAIFPKGITINAADVFALYSVSVVNELISKGNEPFIYLEQRKEVLSVTYGDYTMEIASWCPPICD
jgi:hypothetical protein